MRIKSGEKKLNVAFMAICFTGSNAFNNVINITVTVPGISV